MKVKDVICKAMRLVLKGETADKFSAGTTLDSEEQNAVNQLIRAYNLVLKEVATDHLQMISTLSSNGGKIEFSSFPHFPLNILAVEKDGKRVDYDIYPSFLILPDGTGYSISYSFIPADQALTDNFPYEGKSVDDRAFCYGIAGEFCLMNCRYDEASNWDSKYRKAISSSRKHSAKRVKGRIWA